VNRQRVRDAHPDTRHLAPALRDELRTWMAPLLDSPGSQQAVLETFSQRSREVEANRLTDDVCLVAGSRNVPEGFKRAGAGSDRRLPQDGR
jgi:hypothetical protein